MEFYSVIKNDGPAEALFWKHPKEDFRTGSQLIVKENEEALFAKGGIIYEVFSGGTYSLTTDNYPFIDDIRSMFSGGVNAFSCEVCFVNKTDKLDLKWGTDSPIQVRDPVYGIATQIVSRGSFTIRVSDSKKFVLKFVGGNRIVLAGDAIQKRFRAMFVQNVKSSIAAAVMESNTEILGIASRLNEFAEKITPEVAPALEEYGLELVNFYIAAVDVPEDAPGRRQLEAAMAQRAEFAVLGENWQRAQDRDIMMATAKNCGVAGMGAGIGFGMAAMGRFGSLGGQIAVPSAATSSTATSARFCANCGQPIMQGARFCSGCGRQL